MSLTTPIPSPRWFRNPSLLYGHHPQLGDYIYSPTIESWTQRRATGEGQLFILSGRGRSPSDDQLELWDEIEVRLPELIRAAVEAVADPPVAPRRARFSKAELVIAEVRMELDGAFAFFFGSPVEDEVEMGPMVTFSGWAVTAAEWVG
jgi:hypothetical protein